MIKEKLLRYKEILQTISIFSNVLDWVILLKESEALYSSELQFGFKSGLSTAHCTMSLLETVNYYNFSKTNAYVLMLEVCKAFDRVTFYEKCKRNSNSVVLCIMELSEKNPMSPFGKNIRKYVQCRSHV